MKTIIKDTEKVEIDKKLKKEVQALCEEESQVIVHCRIVEEYGHHIRIWKNTNLIAHGSAKKSALTHSLHIDVLLAPTIIFVTSFLDLLQNEHIKDSSDII